MDKIVALYRCLASFHQFTNLTMKSFITALLLGFISLVGRPATAALVVPAYATPTPVPSQLVHYLVAALQLSGAQTAAVQQALKANPLRVRTPEQITDCLRPVLSPDELSRLIALTNDVQSYEYLNYLARH